MLTTLLDLAGELKQRANDIPESAEPIPAGGWSPKPVRRFEHDDEWRHVPVSWADDELIESASGTGRVVASLDEALGRAPVNPLEGHMSARAATELLRAASRLEQHS